MKTKFTVLRDVLAWNTHYGERLSIDVGGYRKYLHELSIKAFHAQPIEITNVAKYCLEIDPSEYCEYSDFSSLAPPFPLCWFEYEFPEKMNIGGNLHHGYESGTRVGVLCETFRRDDEWVIFFCSWLKIPSEKNTLCPVGINMMILGEGGRYVHRGPEGVGFPVCRGTDVVITHGCATNVIYAFYPFNECGEDSMRSMISGPLTSVLWAIALMHCKNVSVEDVGEAEFRKMNRKERRSIPGVRYKVLNINPMRGHVKHRSELTGESQRVSALSICRGHFKEYKGKGLFGKYQGTYWWDNHVRGAGPGVIEKTYSVSAN